MYLKISHTIVKGVNMAHTKVHGYSAAPRYLYIFVARAVYGGNLIFTPKNVLRLHLKSCCICLPDLYRYSPLLCHLKPHCVKPESIVGTRKEFSSSVPLYPSYLILPWNKLEVYQDQIFLRSWIKLLLLSKELFERCWFSVLAQEHGGGDGSIPSSGICWNWVVISIRSTSDFTPGKGTTVFIVCAEGWVPELSWFAMNSKATPLLCIS
jgi:hypothetical protein